MEGPVTIIDDLTESLRCLNQAGRDVLSPCAAIIADAVRMYANAVGWAVVKHADFEAWAQAQRSPGSSYLTLDPFVRARQTEGDVAVRLSRTSGLFGLQVPTMDDHEMGLDPRRSVVVVDDAASTGDTLLRTTGYLRAIGRSVRGVLLCSVSERARQAVSALYPTLEWSRYTPWDCQTLHLRDACPFLPYAGRPTAGSLSGSAVEGNLEIRRPATAFADGLWAEVSRDPTVRQATAAARRMIKLRLAAAAGRPPVVADVSRLGSHIPLSSYHDHEITMTSSLDSIL